MCAMRIKGFSGTLGSPSKAVAPQNEPPEPPTGAAGARGEGQAAENDPFSDLVAEGVAKYLADKEVCDAGRDPRLGRRSAGASCGPSARQGDAAAPQRASSAVRYAAMALAATVGLVVAAMCAPGIAAAVAEGSAAIGGAASRASQGADAGPLVWASLIDASGHLPDLLIRLGGLAAGLFPAKAALTEALLRRRMTRGDVYGLIRRLGKLAAAAAVLYLAHTALVSVCGAAGIPASIDQVVAAAEGLAAQGAGI